MPGTQGGSAPPRKRQPARRKPAPSPIFGAGLSAPIPGARKVAQAKRTQGRELAKAPGVRARLKPVAAPAPQSAAERKRGEAAWRTATPAQRRAATRTADREAVRRRRQITAQTVRGAAGAGLTAAEREALYSVPGTAPGAALRQADRQQSAGARRALILSGILATNPTASPRALAKFKVSSLSPQQRAAYTQAGLERSARVNPRARKGASKPKGGGGLLKGVERAVGGAAHLLYPAPHGKPAAPTGRRLPGAAAGGRTSALDLPNSAVGIVLRSTASTTAQQPGRAIGDTAKSALLIPAGLIRAGLHPGESVKAIGADYARRYGPALRGDYAQFHRRQMVEGSAPELSDIAGVASGGASVTGRILQKGAEAGLLGEAALKTATKVKPLRVAGGKTGVVVREPSKNFYKNLSRVAVDRRRGKVLEKRPAGGRTALEDVARQEGSVVYASRRKQARVQRKAVAKRGGEVLATMKAEQALEVLGKEGVSGTIRALSKDERRGLNIAHRYAPKSPEAARRIIDQQIARIKAERAAREAAGDPVRPLNDEIPILEALKADAEKVFTPRLRSAVRHEGNRQRRLAAQDPALVQEQTLARAHQPQADLLGIERRDGESAVAFARRVRQEGSKQGMASPSYFKSEEIPRNVFSAFAKGGRRAVAGEKRYTGALAATGRESHSPEILIRQAAQNIKRRFNWNLVGDTVDEHVLPWSKEKKYTAHELEKEAIRRGIDPNTVRAWNPRLFRRIQSRVQDEMGPGADPTLVSSEVEKAVQRAVGDLHDIATSPEDFQGAGWQLLDKAAFDEVMGTVGSGSEGVVGRGYDIAKGKVSRILLANPAWLGFQVASNTFTAGLAGVTPADFVRAQRFFGKEAMKDPKHAAAVEATFGVHGWYDQQRMLGSTSNSRFVDAYRGMKETGFYRKAHSANPLDLLFFRPDNAQNNAFRRALMYSRLKRDAYRAMGADARTIVGAQRRIAGMLTGPPEEVMSRLTRNRALLEKHAQAVDDFLGNWTTYTAKERHFFSRAVMFYGFLRFSTRLAFYTMPAKHPIMSSILLQIGRMEKDELTKIFGTEPPPWEYGNFYAPNKAWGQGVSDAEISKGVTRFPTNRLVPFFNAVTAASGGGEMGSLPPFVGTYLNYRAGKNIALDSPYQVEGSTAYVQHAKDMSGGTRRRIALAETLSLSPYYRAAAAAFLKGKQGDDSLLFSPRPIQYKKADAIARNQAKIAQQRKTGVLGAFQQTLAPQLGTPGSQIILNARSFAAGPKKKTSGRGRSGGGGATFKLGGGSSGGSSSGATFKLGQ